MEPRRARRGRSSARSGSRSSTTSAPGPRRRPRAAGRAAAGVRARPLRGARGPGAGRTSPSEERNRYVEANAAALRALLPADLVFANHIVLGGPVAAAVGVPLRSSTRTARSSSTRCAATSSWSGRDGESLVDAHAVFVGSGAHPPRARGRRRPRGARARGAARRRRRAVQAGAARRRARSAARGGPERSAEPGEPRGAAAGRRQRSAARGVLRHGKADRRLLREADREQGRPGAVRGAAAGSTRAPSSSASATTARRSRRRRRRGPSSPVRSSTATSPHLLPLCDVAAVPSIFPEAFGMVAAEAAAAGVPAGRRGALGPRRGRCGDRTRVSARPRARDRLPDRRRRGAAAAHRRDPRAVAGGAPRPRPRRPSRGRAQLGAGPALQNGSCV